ncbi:MAG TPA: sulfatase-like hydrolase/transferase [Acidimicrobiia bacterium]|nr:sulfatase-like hydrolase/transferase [Acidimicrobiia bacterium]
MPRSMWRRLAVLSGLSAVAVVAPLLDLYGDNPEVFVANRSSATEIVLFGLFVALFIPLLAWAILAAAEALGGKAPLVAYRSLVVVLAAATGLVVSRQMQPDQTLFALVIALVAAALIFWAVSNVEVLFVVAALAVPVAVVMFLATSATARLIWEEPEVVEGAVDVASPAHIVMLQLDEMPLASIMETDGTINETLFPSFARLADEGTWYRNALSDSIATTQSVPAILTGVRSEEGSPSYVDHPDNLFTLLADTYEMHVIEWVADLCPEDACPDYAGRAPARFSNLLKDVGVVYGHLTLPGEMRDTLPSIGNAWRGFLGQEDSPDGTDVEIDGIPVPPGGERQEWVDWIQRLINGIDARTFPILSYAHLRAPHVPWETNPSGTHYERPEEYTEVSGVEGDGRWGDHPSPALLGLQRHLYQVGFLDRMLGRLLDHLDATGTWDDTMVVVVADHGASFEPGEHRRWPFENNRDDLYRVPMFVKYPGQTEGETVDLAAFGIDLLPTIVDALDIDVDWPFDGISLLELDVERPHEPLHWCCSDEGATTDLAALFAQVERNHRWIPDQSSWKGIAAVGTHGALVGRPTTEIGSRDHDGFRWSLDLGDDLESVDRSSGLVQTLISGRVETDEQPVSDQLLIVLNDVVAGVAHLARDSVSGGLITGLVAEELIQDGSNDIDLLIPGDDGVWLAGLRDDITLELATEDGRRLELGTEGSRRIQVDSVEETDDGWEVTGWAADVNEKLIPDMIYVFAGDRLLISGPPNIDNRNVVRWFESDDLLRSGFVFELGANDVPDELDQILVVAEFDGAAVADPATLTR